jgi:hypothetical protein
MTGVHGARWRELRPRLAFREGAGLLPASPAGRGPSTGLFKTSMGVDIGEQAAQQGTVAFQL